MSNDDDFTPISLDTTLDDIEDMPSFGVWPNGAYHVKLNKGIIDKATDKKDWINEHPAISVEMTLMTVAELDPKMLFKGEAPPAPGDIASLMFMLDNKFGAGQYKAFMEPLAEHFQTKSGRMVVENSIGLELAVVLTRSKDKDDPTKFYQRFSKVVVV